MRYFPLQFALVSFSLLLPFAASAHVGYVLEEGNLAGRMGSDFPFLVSPISDPASIALIAAGVLIVLGAYVFFSRAPFVQQVLAHAEKKAESYAELVPWIIRLSLGIALVGAGTGEVLVSPALRGFPEFSFVQILAGFLLLSGFLLLPAALLAVLLFLAALVQSSYILGGLDFFGLALALLLLHESRPGVDHLFGIRFPALFGGFKKYTLLVLRCGIGFAMMYLALYEKILNPHLSELVVQNFNLTSVIPVAPALWVLAAGVIEFLVGLLLVLGWKTRLVSAVAFLILTLSFFYFKEAVYSHVTLFGTLSILVALGGGPWPEKSGEE